MRDKIIAAVLLATVILATSLNTWVLKHKIDQTIEETECIDIHKSGAKVEAEDAFQEFLRRERYISLTVSHDDLTNIEENFCELIGYLGVGDTDGAEIAKYRLIRSLEHLRRFSGFNFDSII